MGKSWLVEQSEHTIFIIKFVYMGMVYGAHTPNSNSNIKEGSVFILAQNASNLRKRLELSIKFSRSFYKHLD